MSVQSDVSAILDDLQDRRHDVWGRHAKNLANGIRKSGVPALLSGIDSELKTLTGVVNAQTNTTVAALSSLAATNAAGFANICAGLSQQTQVLRSIQELLANPLSTAAAERYRRGATALKEGWFDDAATELQASVEQDPFQPLTHYALGLALGAQEEYEEAATAFKSALKYCGSQTQLLPLAAASALLAAQAFEQQGDNKPALDVIEQGLEKAPQCAELLLAKARHTGNPAVLHKALSLAPELATLAVASNIRDAERVAQQVCEDPSGPVAAARKAAAEAKQYGIDVPWPKEVPEQMRFHHTWRHAYVPAIAQKEQQQQRNLQQAKAKHSTASNAQKAASNILVPEVGALFTSGIFTTIAAIVCYTQLIAPAVNKQNTGEFSGPMLIGGVAFWIGLATGIWFLACVGAYRKESKKSKEQQRKHSAASTDAKTTAAALQSAQQEFDTVKKLFEQTQRTLPVRVVPLTVGN